MQAGRRTQRSLLTDLIAADVESARLFDALGLEEPPSLPVLPSLPLRSSLQTWRVNSSKRTPLSPRAGNNTAAPRAVDPKEIEAHATKRRIHAQQQALAGWKESTARRPQAHALVGRRT